jgi:hypothetical protein
MSKKKEGENERERFDRYAPVPMLNAYQIIKKKKQTRK